MPCEVVNNKGLLRHNHKSDVEIWGNETSSVANWAELKSSLECGDYSILRSLPDVFSISVWDEDTTILTIVADRSGIKPIYYYKANGTFLFSSRLEPLMEHPEFHKDIDTSALGFFLQYGYILAPHTIFRNCYKLLPGHVLTYNADTHELKTVSYWDVLEFYNRPTLEVNEGDAIEHVESLLLDALGERSDNFGAFLSGGYDSSLISALLCKKWGGRSRTFAVGFKESKFNEAPFAQAVAKYLNTDHTEFVCSSDDAKSIIRELPEIYDEPFGDSSSIPSLFICRQMKACGIDVAYSGDGGDEVFGGYFKYFISKKLYYQYLRFIPLTLRNAAASMLESIQPERIPWFPAHVHHFAQRYTRGHKLLRCDSPEKIMQSISQVFSHDEIRRFIPDYQYTKTFFDLDAEFSPELDHINRMMAIDYKTYLPGDGNIKVGNASMASGLLVRSPMLEPSIIEYMAQLPSSYKVRGHETKRLLKELTHRYIPKELMDRPKKGFSIPVADWLRGPLKSFVFEYLDGDKLTRHGVFNNVGDIIKMRNEFMRTGFVDFNRIWFFLTFQMWYERWMR